MRIAYLSAVGALGGAERCLLQTMAAVRAETPSAELHLLSATDGPLLGRAQELGAQVRVLPMPAAMASLGDSALRERGRVRAACSLLRRALRAVPSLRGYAHWLRETLRAIGPDLIHSNGVKTHLLSALARHGAAPVVWHVHDFFSQRPVMARALRWASRRSAGAIAISQAIGNDVRHALRDLPTEVVYNAIDVDEFSPGPGDGTRLDQLAGLPPAEPGTVRVGLVATYARWKGHDVFLDAAAQLARRPGVPRTRFYIIGGPIYLTHGSQFSEDELRRRTVELGLAEAVGFIGFQQDVAGIYRDLDIVVHASTRPEPFGLTIVEAMACGRPVLVANAGGAAELFTDRWDAHGVPLGDATALASAIAELASDAELRCRLGRQARQTAVTKFSSKRLGGQLTAAYQRFRGWGERGCVSAPRASGVASAPRDSRR